MARNLIDDELAAAPFQSGLAAPQPVAPMQQGSDIIGGLKAAGGQLLAGAGSLAEFATGDRIGAGLREYGQEITKAAEAGAAGSKPEGDYADRVQFQVAQQATQSLAPGLIGAIGGGLIGGPPGAALGGLIGGTIGNFGLELAGQRQEQQDIAGKGTTASLAPYAVGNAALETANTAAEVGLGYLGAKLAAKGLSFAPGPVGAAGKAASAFLKTVPGKLTGGALGGAASATILEPPIETLQELGSIYARQTYDPSYTTDKSEVQQRLKDTYLQTLEIAPWLGGIFGIVGGGQHYLNERRGMETANNDLGNRLASALGFHPDDQTPLNAQQLVPLFEQRAASLGVDVAGLRERDAGRRVLALYDQIISREKTQYSDDAARATATERAETGLRDFARSVGVDPDNTPRDQLATAILDVTRNREIQAQKQDGADALAAKVLGNLFTFPESRMTRFELAQSDPKIAQDTYKELSTAAQELGLDPKTVAKGSKTAEKLEPLYNAILDKANDTIQKEGLIPTGASARILTGVARNGGLNSSLGISSATTSEQKAAREQRIADATEAFKKIKGSKPVTGLTKEDIAKALKAFGNIDPLHPANFALDNSGGNFAPGSIVMFADSPSMVNYAVVGTSDEGVILKHDQTEFTVPKAEAAKILFPVDLVAWRSKVPTSAVARLNMLTNDAAAVTEKAKKYSSKQTQERVIKPPAFRVIPTAKAKAAIESADLISRERHFTTRTGVKPLADTSPLALAVRSGNVKDTLNELVDYFNDANAPVLTAIARRLQSFDFGNLSLDSKTYTGKRGEYYGFYSPSTHSIKINDHGMRASTILHEFVHAATYHQFRTLKSADPNHVAVKRLEKIHREVRQYLTDRKESTYAVTNIDEFLAESFSNSGFQDFLRGFNIEGQSAWTRFVKAVARILGLNETQGNALTEILNLTEEHLFSISPDALRNVSGFEEESILGAPPPTPPTEFERAKYIRDIEKANTVSLRTGWQAFSSNLSDAALKLAPMTQYVRQMAKYFATSGGNSVNRIDDLRKERSAREDKIATRTVKYVHDFDRQSGDAKRRVNDALHAAGSTLLDPRKPEANQDFTRIEWERRNLTAKFGDYSDAYARVVEAYSKLQTEKERHFFNETLDQTRKLTEDYISATLTRYFESLDTSLPLSERKRLVDEARVKFSLLPGAYLPNMRYGDYMVSVGRMVNGKFVRDYFTTYETRATAESMREALKAEGHEVLVEETRDFHQRVDGAGAATLGRVEASIRDSLIKKSGLDPKDPDYQNQLDIMNAAVARATATIREAMLDATPEASFYKTQQLRNFTQGESMDRMRDHMTFTMKMAHRIGDVEFGLKQYDELAKMRALIVETGKDPSQPQAKHLLEMSKVYNDMVERVDSASKSGTNKFVDIFTRWSFAVYLSGISQFFVQITQPYTYWLGKMAGAGFDASSVFSRLTAEMGKNLTNKRLFQKDLEQEINSPQLDREVERIFRTVSLEEVLDGRSTKSVGDYFHDKADIEFQVSQLPEATQRLLALRLAMDRGLVDISMSHEARQRAAYKTIYGGTSETTAERGLNIARQAGRGLEWVLSLPMQKSELLVRMSTMLAGYDLKRESGASFLDAVKFSDDMTRATQYDYSGGNRAPIFNNPTSRLLLNLQTFRINSLASFALDFYDAYKNVDPNERAAARRSLGWLYFSTAMLGGATAVPFASIALWIISKAVEIIDDEPWDAEAELKRVADENWPFGVTLTRGLPAAFGVDISKRVGLGDLTALPFQQVPDYMEGRSAADRAGVLLLGPTWDSSGRMAYEGVKAWRDEDWTKFITTVAPKAIADVAKGVDIAEHGVRTSAKETLIADPSVADIALAMIGIKSTDIAAAQDKNNAISKYQTDLRQASRHIVHDYVTAAQSDGDLSGSFAKIAAWNAAHPEAPINGTTLRSAYNDAVRKQLGIRAKGYERVAQEYGFK